MEITIKIKIKDAEIELTVKEAKELHKIIGEVIKAETDWGYPLPSVPLDPYVQPDDWHSPGVIYDDSGSVSKY